MLISHETPTTVKVFNFDSGLANPLKWSDCFRSIVDAAVHRYCLENAAWVPSHKQHDRWICFKVHTILYEALPAYSIDLARRLVGRKPVAVKLYKRVQNMTRTLRYFMFVSCISFPFLLLFFPFKGLEYIFV
jgi:hypothetical protein